MGFHLPTDQEIVCYLVGYLCKPGEEAPNTSFVDTIFSTGGVISALYLFGRAVKMYMDYKAAVAREDAAARAAAARAAAARAAARAAAARIAARAVAARIAARAAAGRAHAARAAAGRAAKSPTTPTTARNTRRR